MVFNVVVYLAKSDDKLGASFTTAPEKISARVKLTI
jgi:hypothetical protein